MAEIVKLWNWTIMILFEKQNIETEYSNKNLV